MITKERHNVGIVVPLCCDEPTFAGREHLCREKGKTSQRTREIQNSNHVIKYRDEASRDCLPLPATKALHFDDSQIEQARCGIDDALFGWAGCPAQHRCGVARVYPAHMAKLADDLAHHRIEQRRQADKEIGQLPRRLIMSMSSRTSPLRSERILSAESGCQQSLRRRATTRTGSKPARASRSVVRTSKSRSVPIRPSAEATYPTSLITERSSSASDLNNN